MSRLNPLQIRRFTTFTQILKKVPTNTWFQVAPLFGSTTQYKHLYKACSIERGELIGVLLNIDLVKIQGSEVQLQKAVAGDIADEVSGIDFNYAQIFSKNRQEKEFH